MNICHWLLGIGDRHLENTLVRMTDGQLFGIDFGHAFGTATQNLPIPELMPFRLTPKILMMFSPFKETGRKINYSYFIGESKDKIIYHQSYNFTFLICLILKY